MNKSLKNFLTGKVSYAQSFWLWYFVGSTVLSIPFYLITDEAITSSTGVGLFTLIYFILFICALIFLIIGTWRSAENYKRIQKNKNKGSGWAIAGQIYLALATLRGAIEIFKMFSN